MKNEKCRKGCTDEHQGGAGTARTGSRGPDPKRGIPDDEPFAERKREVINWWRGLDWTPGS